MEAIKGGYSYKILPKLLASEMFAMEPIKTYSFENAGWREGKNDLIKPVARTVTKK
jgi:hypothetical protein